MLRKRRRSREVNLTLDAGRLAAFSSAWGAIDCHQNAPGLVRDRHTFTCWTQFQIPIQVGTNFTDAALATRALSDHPDTQEQYGRILRRFGQRCLECGQAWEKADADWLDVYTQQRAWARHSRGGLYAANTLDQERRVLRHFYRWAFGEGLVALNPTQHWVLPRPVQPDRNLLTRLQVQQLLNLPDLTSPIGQRDQLVMELLYGPGLAVSQLHLFTIDWNPDWEPIRATWEAYLREGRRRLQTCPSDKLLLNKFGRPMTSPLTLRLRLKAYGKQIGANVDLRSLQQAFKYHTEELARRHTQVPRPGS